MLELADRQSTSEKAAHEDDNNEAGSMHKVR